MNRPNPSRQPAVSDGLAARLLVFLLLAGVATLSYANTFQASFHFDDVFNIVDNPQIKSFSAFRDLSGSRYLGFLTFAVNYYVGGLSVGGYHVVNLLIHITNGFLVYTLVGLLGRTPGLGTGAPSREVALLTALLFVVHPLQTQAVTYIVQRFASLAALLYLLAIICFVQWRLADPARRSRYGWYGGALLSTILAMKTKETSFTLPVMLLVVEGVCFRSLTWKRWLPLIPFLLTLPIIPMALSGALGEAEVGFTRETMDISRLSYLFTQCRVLVTYLRLLVWPTHQNLDYDYPIYDSVLDPSVFVSGLFLFALLGLAMYLVYARSAYRLAGFGLLWFFLTLSVESSLIPIRDVIFEHRVYLPSVGALLAISVVGVASLRRWHAVAPIVMGIVVIAFAVVTYQRNAIWKDENALWSNVVAESPQKARGHNNLGYTYQQQGRLEVAVTEIVTALRLRPTFLKAHYNLGNIYLQQGRLDEAITELTTAIHLKPDFEGAHNSLGAAYAQQGRLEQAIQEYLTAVRLNPDYPEPHKNLGAVYVQQGRLEQAIQEYLTALHLNPNYPGAHNSLGAVYAQQGRPEQAIQEYRTALTMKPNDPDTHYNLGNAFNRQGLMDKAIQEYLTTVHLDPNNADAHNNLGNLYARLGRVDEAIPELEVAGRLTPAVPEIHNNLGSAYTQQGQFKKAASEYVTAALLNPGYVEAHYNLGNLYAQQGLLAEAIKEYMTVVRLRADFPEAYYNLGMMYQLKGLKKEAREQFQTVLRLRPDFAPAQQALTALDDRRHR